MAEADLVSRSLEDAARWRDRLDRLAVLLPANARLTDVDFNPDQSTGGATSWTWSFGDGSPLSYVQNPAHTYASVGQYDVTLTATNAYGSDTETKYDYITATEVVANSMHVHDMDVWRTSAGANCDAYAKIWIYDQSNAPLASASVTVTVSGPLSGTGTGLPPATWIEAR